MKKIFSMLLITMLVLSCVAPTLAEGRGDNPVGLSIADFDTVDIFGNAVTGEILSEYDVTLVNFWATWCGPCRNELSHLQEIYENYSPSKKVNVIGILSEGGGSTPSAAAELLSSKGCTYTTIRIGNDSALQKLIDNSGPYIPVSYAVNSEGVVVDSVVGGMTYSAFVNFLSPYADMTPPAQYYTVRFIDWDQSLISTQEVLSGENAELPAEPQRDGYLFAEWDASHENITRDTDIFAKYAQFGDANLDDIVNTGDAVRVLRHSVSLETLVGLALRVSDVNHDTSVNTGDAVLILRSTVMH